MDKRILVEGRIANIGIGRQDFFQSSHILFCGKKKVFGSFQTTQLCKVGTLSRGGAVAMAVCVSDR